MEVATAHTPHIQPTELVLVQNEAAVGTGRRVYASSVGGHREEYTFEPRCGVCKCPEVESIHRWAANGTPISRIGSMLRDDGIKIQNRQIKHHLCQHVPGYANYERAIASAAKAFGEGEFPARVSGLHASQIIIERGTKMLAEGRITLRARDILAAARFQYEIEAGGGDVADASSYAAMMDILLHKFYRAIGPARFNAVMSALSVDPRVIAIMHETGISPAASIERELEHDPLRELIKTF